MFFPLPYDTDQRTGQNAARQEQQGSAIGDSRDHLKQVSFIQKQTDDDPEQVPE